MPVIRRLSPKKLVGVYSLSFSQKPPEAFVDLAAGCMVPLEDAIDVTIGGVTGSVHR